MAEYEKKVRNIQSKNECTFVFAEKAIIIYGTVQSRAATLCAFVEGFHCPLSDCL